MTARATVFSALSAMSQLLFCCGVHSPRGVMSMKPSDSEALSDSLKSVPENARPR